MFKYQQSIFKHNNNMNKYKKYTIITIVFFLILYILLFYKEINNQDIIRKYSSIITYELPDFWKPSKQQLDLEEKKATMDKKPENILVNSTKFKVTREQLGHNTWQLLHMISGSMPDKFDDQFKQRINMFINLFGQFYPCKLCASHFLEHIKDFPFNGNTKESFMMYMCQLHNIVNKALNKPVYDCSNIVQQWSFCGCTSGGAQKPLQNK